MSYGYSTDGYTSSNYTLPDGGYVLVRSDYTRANANGVLVLILTSSISIIAVLGLLGAIAISAFNTRTSGDKNLFVRTHVAAYFISLLTSDLIQAVGSIMNAHWYAQMHVEANTFCTVQGALKQAADVSTALWTLVIAIHTFCMLFLQMQLKRYVLWATMIAVWSGIIAVVLAGPAALNTTKHGPFFGISGYWCWIAENYPTERITLDYLVMFFSALSSFVLYSLVFLKLRGNIVVNGWNVRFQRISTARSSTWRGRQLSNSQTLTIARQMLLYPIAYTILILPIAAARFSAFANIEVPFDVTIFCDTIFLMSGLVNVVLFTTTRRILPPGSIIKKAAISNPTLVAATSMAGAEEDPYYRDSASMSDASFNEKAPDARPIDVHLGMPQPPQPMFIKTDYPDVPGSPDSRGSFQQEPLEERQTRLLSPNMLSPHNGFNPVRATGQSVFSLYDSYGGSNPRSPQEPVPQVPQLDHHAHQQ